ncbi:hypothetical protein Acsp04_15410 [Actinomadura sp. NBRC 104425]|uniref:cellulose binding domain-containing protein n=1 Tax=Actinomadura sp. NBRC 104425 TaxID=3032204 RepID=UPI0024A463D1|nr:cellulose binding domain-containing protein [Actinomadura sp. NBRC 104425]GLZ11306.1 hypothetical protein Acsp04_15410 [Actinomadura sp. NBRC 104425]
MGRHTKPNRPADEGDATGADPPENGRRWIKLIGLVPLPLFPMLALVMAVGVVSYAFSTQQISLNFAGGAPSEPHTGSSQVSERGQGDRASRGAERADGLVVAFRVASRTETGYRATATVTNRGTEPVAKWALAFRIKNSKIVSFSGATVVRTGTTGFVRSRPGAPALAPGRSVRVVFVGTGTPRGPYYCILNRLRCTRV